MVIHGHYGADRTRVPGPFVTAYVSFTRLGAQGWVEFLVDSGANGVYLHLADAQRIRITRDSLRQSSLQESFGIAGSEKYFTEPGLLSFGEEIHVRHHLNIYIARGESATPESVPSLLGRDFLNLCDLRLDYATDLVSLTPRNVNEYGEIPAQ